MTDLRQSKVTRAISRRKGMNLGPAWSPDGKTMVVTLSKDGSPDLYLIDREGKIIRRLTARGLRRSKPLPLRPGEAVGNIP